jgi:predicted aspartyl protease
MIFFSTGRQIALLLLTGCLAGHQSAAAQMQPDAELEKEISHITLLTAPDETSPPIARVQREELGPSPIAQVLGAAGAKWYLVKTKAGIAGWMSAGDVDARKDLEPFFKPLPAELSVASPVEIPAAGPTSTPSNAIVIPIQTNGSSVIVPVTLNRAVQAYMILDTGASFTVVSQQLAASLGLRPTRRISLVTANGVVGAPLAPLGSLKVGDAEATNLTVVIQDFSPTPSLGGLLGLDFLSRYHTSIDLRRQLLVLAPR